MLVEFGPKRRRMIGNLRARRTGSVEAECEDGDFASLLPPSSDSLTDRRQRVRLGRHAGRQQNYHLL